MANLPVQPSETILGADCSIKGEMSFEGTMRVDGRFEGKLTSKGRLVVGKGAQISGDMQVGSVQLDGTARANIVATEKVDLNATAQVHGDVRAPRLTVAEGAVLVGQVQISPDALKGSNERDAILSGAVAPSARDHQHVHPPMAVPVRR